MSMANLLRKAQSQIDVHGVFKIHGVDHELTLHFPSGARGRPIQSIHAFHDSLRAMGHEESEQFSTEGGQDSGYGHQDDHQSTADEVFMREALTLARQAEANGEVPVGAVVVVNGEIVGRGFNSPIRISIPPRTRKSSLSARPAQRCATIVWKRATLYATLEPCVMCAGALVAARVRRLVFGARDLRFGGVRSKFRLADSELLNHRVEIVEGVLAAECVELMKNFFEQRR